MIENSPKWKNLHIYQKVKYIAEILAICGGLFLLALNVYQVGLLSQSVEINRQVYNSTFPLEVQSDLVDYVDGKPVVIKLKLTNVIGRRMQLHTWVPKVVRTGSDTVETDYQYTKIELFKTKVVPAPLQGIDRQIILNGSESCFLELSTKLDVPADYSENDTFKHRSERIVFIIIPVRIESFSQSTSKLILLTLLRGKNKSLLVISDILRETDDNTLMLIARIKRAQLSVPAPNEY